MTALLRTVSVSLTLALLAACAPQQTVRAVPAAPPAVRGAQEYRLGIGDVISIRVYGGEEEMRFERVRLSEPGVVTLPFGEFKALGQTTRELESAIVKSVRGRLLVNPRVWVNIDEYRPFFVQGQVSRPGAYPYQPGLTITKAVTIAGGFRERASLQKIFIVREQDAAANRAYKADLGTPVGPGDIITVEESFF